jgi:outer membrane protein OmpA-like peptidoglycan-associated protein
MTQKEDSMKTIHFLIIVTFVALFAGCASVAPKELISARSAYQVASQGPAEQLVPAELHKAHDALVLAEESFQKEPNSYKTKDLAYVAQRKSEMAGALGAMAADKARKDKANADYQKKQTEIVKQGKQDLIDSERQRKQDLIDSERQRKQDLIDSERQKNQALIDSERQKNQALIDSEKQRKQDFIDSEKRKADTLSAMAADKAIRDKANADYQKQQDEIVRQSKQDLIDSEKRTAAALAELAKIAAVKEEDRGLVVTLSGNVLFRSAKSTLLPSAKVKLDQVSNALLSIRARRLIVEGHTDSQGSEAYNQGLSQRRADAVRDYLVQRGYPADLIQTRGMGEGSAIANNASPEGRANNRRVEIVIERM